MAEAATPCCKMRMKAVMNGISIRTVEECGVSDTELCDFMVFDERSPRGRSVLMPKFCLWCGKPWQRLGAVWELDQDDDDESDAGDAWKQGVKED